LNGWFEIERIKRTSHYSMTVNHFHDYYELYYLLSGERFYFIQNTTYHVRQGDLIFIDKRLLHKTIDTGIPAHERILVHFNDDLLRSPQLTELFRMDNPILRTDEELSADVQRLLLRLLQEVNEQDIYYWNSIENLVSELLILCARGRKRLQANLDAASDQPLSLHPRMTEIIHYLNDHYAQSLTLTTIANLFRLSPAYVSRTFKRATGFSFIEFLNHIRIREAQRLLRETAMPIIRIADEAGFQSITHFGRVFKQISGCSPREFRARNRLEYSDIT
jgi:AraC-like DNA-binding protein